MSQHSSKSPALIAAISGLVALAIAAFAVLLIGPSSADAGRTSSKLGPYPSLGGCPIFPPSTAGPTDPAAADETAWNQNISQAPLDPKSDAYMAYLTGKDGGNLHPDFGSPRQYGMPYSVVGAKQPKIPVHFTAYGAESDHVPYRIPKNAPVEGGAGSDGDRHILTIDKSRCLLQELGVAFYKRKPKPHYDAAGGVSWNLRSPNRRTEGFTSADAAGLPIFAGLVRFDEVQAGAINHAIRLTFSSTQDAWIHPASHCAGSTSSPAAPPEGLRLRMKANFPTGGFTGQSAVIVTALKNYGFIVADNGSNWYFSGTTDKRWSDNNLNQLKDIPDSAFEVVQSADPVQTC